MVKPKVQAKSSRAADRPAFGFGNTSFGGFATATSPLSYLTELPDTSKISDPNTAVLFKNLFKRDSTTKVRALEELQNHLSSKSEQGFVVEDAILDIWIAIYPRTSIDSVRRVRLLAHSVQGLISSSVGKSLAKHMPTLAGSWLLGSYDTDKAVANEAQSSLARVFAPDKQLALRKAFQPQIVQLCNDIIDKESAKTLSDERVISKDEAAEKYNRVVASALGLLVSMLSSLSESDRQKEADKYAQILRDDKLWGLIASKDTSVRKNVNLLLRTCLLQDETRSLLDLKSLSVAYVEKGLKSDRVGTASDFISTLAALTKVLPGIWTRDWCGKKAPYVRLQDFLKAGSRGASSSYWQEVSAILQLIPKEAFPSSSDETIKLLEAYREGATGKSELKSYMRPGLDGYIDAIPSFISNLGENKDRKAVLSQSVFILIESFVLAAPEAPWTVAVATGSRVVRQILEIEGMVTITTANWKQITNTVIERMKLSLPESSKDYKMSQDNVKETGLRWVLATKELFDISSTANKPEIEAEIVKVVRSSIELCQSRKGKPYGAAITMQVLLRYLSPLLWQNSETSQLLDNFVSQSLPQIFMSPSTSSLSLILLAAKDRLYFEQTCTTCLSKVVATDNTRAKIEAFTELLNVAKQSNASFMTGNHDIEALIQSQMDLAIIEGDHWDSFVNILTVVENQKAIDILAVMASKLTLADDGATNTLNGFFAIGTSEPSLLGDFVSSTHGPALLTTVLRLTEAQDDVLAHAASKLNNMLHQSPNTTHNGDRSSAKQNRMAQVIALGLNNASVDSVSVDTLISQASSVLALADASNYSALLPDTTTWQFELETFLNQAVPFTIDTMQPVSSNVFNLELGSVSGQTVLDISRDAEGLSIPLRMAIYTVRLFEVITLADIPVDVAAELVTLLLLTTTLTNINLSVKGSNDIWISHGPVTDEEIAEFLSASQHLLSAWLSSSVDWWLNDNQDSSFLAVDKSMQKLSHDAQGNSSASYCSSKAYEYVASQLITKHGLSQRRLSEVPATLATLRRSEQLLQSSAFIIAHGDFISNFPITKSWYNALIADATGLDFSEQRSMVIRRLSLLNVFLSSMDDDFLATAALQRLTILFRDTVSVLADSGDDTVVQSLILSILGKLVSPLKEVYGEYWATMINFVKDLWLKTSSLQTSQPQDASLNRLHESQRLYRALKRVSVDEDCNEDLVEALTASMAELHNGLLHLLTLDASHSDEFNQPLRTIRDFSCNEIIKSPIDLEVSPEDLYPVIDAQNESVQACAYRILHSKVPQMQEQISLEVAIEKIVARIPEELLSLILDAPVRIRPEALDDLATQLAVKRYLFAWALIFDHFTNAVSAAVR